MLLLVGAYPSITTAQGRVAIAKKTLPIPPMLIDLVGNALASMDGVIFDDLDACPSCGGQVIGHDMRAKRFAVILDNEKERTIRVFVKRFYCQDCGALCYADAPFYPDTRLAAPVVDLCLLLAQQMPYNQVAQHLRAMGIVVDRGTIRNYASRDFGTIRATDLFGFLLPLSLLNLATFTLDRERRPIVGAEALAACGFPPAGRAPLHGRAAPEERDQRNEQEEKEERES
ncbi:MAG: hypothetical protein PWQ30_1259 [Euryarchaeota archaeon]|jgi:hypothetical protein|nr:hypothetical protein [Euryarchaeota archaeon]